MKKHLAYLLFPFLLNNLYAQEKKEEPKKHNVTAEETFMLTETTVQNLVKGKYRYITDRLEQLVESSFDYMKTDDEIKRKLFRTHYKLDIKNVKWGVYGFVDTDYQDDRLNFQVLYMTAGGGKKLSMVKLDFGWGYKVVERSTFINVVSSSAEINKKINSKWDLSGTMAVKKPLKSPKNPSFLAEVKAKYKLSDHLNAVASFNWARERPKNPGSWIRYALRVGGSLDY